MRGLFLPQLRSCMESISPEENTGNGIDTDQRVQSKNTNWYVATVANNGLCLFGTCSTSFTVATRFCLSSESQ
eukprot:5103877-Amphidinium_carterae.1